MQELPCHLRMFRGHPARRAALDASLAAEVPENPHHLVRLNVQRLTASVLASAADTHRALEQAAVGTTSDQQQVILVAGAALRVADVSIALEELLAMHVVNVMGHGDLDDHEVSDQV